jgi:hypothetical protein
MSCKFSRGMLPVFGVSRNEFSTKHEALTFARWAVDETVRDEFPCSASVQEHDNKRDWVVHVVNW